MIGLVKTLHDLQKVLEEKIEHENYRLLQAPPDKMMGKESPKLINPRVTTGCLPHANFSLYGAENEFFQAPYVLVGFEESGLDSDSQNVDILINVCCYSSGLYITNPSDEGYSLMLPDNRSYEDCITFLEWIKTKLIEQNAINGATIEYPIQLGTYNTKELTYPYTFGYLKFSLNSDGYSYDRKKFNY